MEIGQARRGKTNIWDMRSIIVLKGLPASGKTTYAKKLIDDNPGVYKRVNKDSLRLMLDNSRWSKSNEKFILKLRDHIIEKALEDGKHVIVDDTNIFPQHEARIRQIGKDMPFDVSIKVKDFMHVPVDECIKRDNQRDNPVGEDVIKKMYFDYLKISHGNKLKHEVRYNPNLDLPKAIIVDLDGTLALMNDRDPYDGTKVHTDILNIPVAEIVKVMSHNYSVILVSAREDSCKELTENWLKKHNIPYNNIFLRKSGDYRKDRVVKKEIYDNYIRDKYNVMFVMDDRPQVTRLWKELGLFVLDVYQDIDRIDF